jgi:putative endonuclease
MTQHNYYVYIVTNKHRSVVYTGVTNNLQRRVYEHENGLIPGFSKKYNCHYLIWYERFQYIQHAIDREKEIKKWRREKKNRLIKDFNPTWNFLNEEINQYL